MKRIFIGLLLLCYTGFIALLPLVSRATGSGCAHTTNAVISSSHNNGTNSNSNTAGDDAADNAQNMQLIEEDDCNCQEPVFTAEHARVYFIFSKEFSERTENKTASGKTEIIIPPPEC